MAFRPPVFADLRALVRGELTESERAGLSAWLVVHAGEDIGRALDALAVEWGEVQRDRLLPAAPRELSAAFWPVFELGFADIDPDPTPARPDLLKASPSLGAVTSVTMPRVELVDPLRRVIHVAPPIGCSVFASNDRGEVHALGADVDYECALDEGRVTLWAISGQKAAGDCPELLAAVREALPRGDVCAVRITEHFFAV